MEWRQKYIDIEPSLSSKQDGFVLKLFRINGFLSTIVTGTDVAYKDQTDKMVT